LLGAAVDFLDEPKFEGRNHIVAEDGFEGVVPCHLRIQKDNFLVQRKFADAFNFPPVTADDFDMFGKLQATGVNISPGAIGEATGIFDLAPVWEARTAELQKDLAAAKSDVERAALSSRIASMSDPNNARYFAARMLYSIPLGGSVSTADPQGLLPGKPSAAVAWPLEFWCGAWDPDALCGFMVGFLAIPTEAASDAAKNIAAMMADPRNERR
jgi:hypothetical protein